MAARQNTNTQYACDAKAAERLKIVNKQQTAEDLVITENVPDAVRKQAEDAQRAIDEHRQKRKAAKGQPPAADAPNAVVEHATAGAADGTPTVAQSSASSPSAAPVQKVDHTGRERTPSPPPPASPTEQPAAQESPAPAAAVDDDTIAELHRQNAELKHQLSTFHGRYGDTVSKLRSQLATLEQKLNAIETTTAPRTPASHQPATAENVEAAAAEVEAHEMSDEDIERRFGPEFVTAVRKIVGRNDGPSKALRQEDLDRSVGELRAELATRSFWDDVDRLHPGASAVNGDDDAGIPCATGWGKFLDTPVREGSPITRRTEAEHAVRTHNALAFVRLVEEFEAGRQEPARTEPTAPKGPQRPTVAAQAVPRSTAGSAAPRPAMDPSKRKIPLSEIEAFNRRCRQGGQAGISVAEVNAKLAEYRTAMQQGRVDFKT